MTNSLKVLKFFLFLGFILAFSNTNQVDAFIEKQKHVENQIEKEDTKKLISRFIGCIKRNKTKIAISILIVSIALLIYGIRKGPNLKNDKPNDNNSTSENGNNNSNLKPHLKDSNTSQPTSEIPEISKENEKKFKTSYPLLWGM